MVIVIVLIGVLLTNYETCHYLSSTTLRDSAYQAMQVPLLPVDCGRTAAANSPNLSYATRVA